MKNLFKSLMFVAVAAMTFTACSEIDDSIDATRRVSRIDLSATICEDGTRSGFTERVEETDEEGNTTYKYKSAWDGNESVIVVLADNEAYMTANATINEAGESATFGVEFEEVYQTGTLYAFTPAEAWAENENTKYGSMTAIIPTEQTPRAGSVDPKAHLLYAQGPFYTDGNLPTSGELNFWHGAAYGKMAINLEGVAIESLKISFEAENPYYGSAINTTYTLDATNVENNTFWFACEEMNVREFTVIATGNDGVNYSKAVTIPEGRKLEFRNGKVSTFSVSGLSDAILSNCAMAGAYYNDGEYVVSVREDGAEILYLSLYCPTSVFKVIPEGTYPIVTYADLDEDGGYDASGDCYILGDYSYSYNGSSAKVSSGSVVVEHLEAGYHIAVECVDANGVAYSYVFAGIMEPANDWSSIGNPPIPYDETTYNATLESITGSFIEGYTNSYMPEYSSGDRFALAFITSEPAYRIDIMLEVPMGQDTYGIIPEGIYTLGVDDALAITEEAYSQPVDGDMLRATAATLKVKHNATKNGYDFELRITNALKTTIALTTTVERIATLTEWDTPILSPRDTVVKPLATPDVVSTVEGNRITLTWDLVANADRYVVLVDGSEVYSGNYLTYTITDLDYDIEYTIQVVAYPAASATTLKESDPWMDYVRTAKKSTPDYEIELTGITFIDGNTIRFIGDSTADYMEIEFNPGLTSFVAGRYEGVDINQTGYTSTSALEFNTFESCFGIAELPSEYPYYTSDDSYIDVAVFGSDYLFVAYLYAHINGSSALVKYTYEGALEVGGESVKEFDGTITSWLYTDTAWPTFYAIEGNGFSMEIGMYTSSTVSGQTYIAVRNGGYSLGDSYSFARYFSVNKLTIDGIGSDLTATSGYVMVNEGGSAGDIHDIDITLTVNGTDYEFIYYGYINGEAIEGGNPDDDDEPEVPVVEPTDITLKTMAEGESIQYYYTYNLSNGSDTSFDLMMINDIANNTSITSGSYSYVTSTDYVGKSTFSFRNGSLKINGTTYNNDRVSAGTATISSTGENYTITIVITIGSTEYTLRYNGAIGNNDSGDNGGGNSGGGDNGGDDSGDDSGDNTPDFDIDSWQGEAVSLELMDYSEGQYQFKGSDDYAYIIYSRTDKLADGIYSLTDYTVFYDTQGYRDANAIGMDAFLITSYTDGVLEVKGSQFIIRTTVNGRKVTATGSIG